MSGFSEALADVMASSGLTQKELADRMDMRQGTISEWTTGQGQPAMQTAFRLEKTLGVEPGSLSGELGYPPRRRQGILGQPRR